MDKELYKLSKKAKEFEKSKYDEYLRKKLMENMQNKQTDMEE